jgi:hypothetical protein
MLSKFFIDRPIFAWVIAIIVMLAGIIAIKTLPIAQYPSIAPPAISITATYPGASAKTLEDTVTQVIEQNMKGLYNLSYMASTSESSGTATVTLTFDNKTNPDTAQVQVQNKLTLATPLLPQEVQMQGVQVAKSVTNFLAIIGSDGSMSAADLSDYVAAHFQDPIGRVPGIGDTQLFGSQHAMRIWLDPSKLNNYKLTPGVCHAAGCGCVAGVDPRVVHDGSLSAGRDHCQPGRGTALLWAFDRVIAAHHCDRRDFLELALGSGRANRLDAADPVPPGGGEAHQVAAPVERTSRRHAGTHAAAAFLSTSAVR